MWVHQRSSAYLPPSRFDYVRRSIPRSHAFPHIPAGGSRSRDAAASRGSHWHRVGRRQGRRQTAPVTVGRKLVVRCRSLCAGVARGHLSRQAGQRREDLVGVRRSCRIPACLEAKEGRCWSREVRREGRRMSLSGQIGQRREDLVRVRRSCRIQRAWICSWSCAAACATALRPPRWALPRRRWCQSSGVAVDDGFMGAAVAGPVVAFLEGAGMSGHGPYGQWCRRGNRSRSSCGR